MTLSIDTLIYLLGLAATAGTILTRISALEKKVEKHNNLVERMYKVESRIDFCEERIA